MCRAISLTRALQITPRGNHLDTLCGTLEKKMQFAEGERDIVMYVDTPPSTKLLLYYAELGQN